VVTIPITTGSQGQNLTAALIAVVSLLAGALIVGLGYVLYLSGNQSMGKSPNNSDSSQASKPAAPAVPVVSPPQAAPAAPTSKFQAPEGEASTSAWGSAADYKFGQLPGGDYPNSCAFSKTDANGKVITDRASLEFWACRDMGGDPSTGYTVIWADGKRTVYTFGSNGEGTIVGTNNSSYPVSWSNDTHNGTDIIVIRHQDGAQSWIPGKVGD
jgi:hypothetical protein